MGADALDHYRDRDSSFGACGSGALSGFVLDFSGRLVGGRTARMHWVDETRASRTRVRRRVGQRVGQAELVQLYPAHGRQVCIDVVSGEKYGCLAEMGGIRFI
jgi:hypothetical protein